MPPPARSIHTRVLLRDRAFRPIDRAGASREIRPRGRASSPSLLEEVIGPDEVLLGLRPGHQRNFLDCVRSRQRPIAPAEAGHRTATICHLNKIVMLVVRPLAWDPEAERETNCEEANCLLTPMMRPLVALTGPPRNSGAGVPPG